MSEFEAYMQKTHDLLRKYQGMADGHQKELAVSDGLDERRKTILENKYMRMLSRVDEYKARIEFSRPEKEDDMQERLQIIKDFPEQVAQTVPEDLPLRFHGTNLPATRNILESGEISSSVDRKGYETSYDVAGQVSVTSKDNIRITVDGYCNLSGDYKMPAGCIFVMLPKSEEEAKMVSSLMMENVNFRENPERLFAVITTKENVETVGKWMQENGFDARKSCSYEEFIKDFDRLYQIHNETQTDKEQTSERKTERSVDDAQQQSSATKMQVADIVRLGKGGNTGM